MVWITIPTQYIEMENELGKFIREAIELVIEQSDIRIVSLYAVAGLYLVLKFKHYAKK